jgi:hypothetical protein
MSDAYPYPAGAPECHCDFCHAAGLPLTAYACDTFTVLFVRRGPAVVVEVVGGVVTRYRPAPGDGEVLAFCSLGGWAACAGCAALIDAGDAPALGRRMLARLAADGLPAALRGVAERQVLAALRGFWAHRACPN